MRFALETFKEVVVSVYSSCTVGQLRALFVWMAASASCVRFSCGGVFQACLLCVAFSSLFVGSLYVWPNSLRRYTYVPHVILCHLFHSFLWIVKHHTWTILLWLWLILISLISYMHTVQSFICTSLPPCLPVHRNRCGFSWTVSIKSFHWSVSYRNDWCRIGALLVLFLLLLAATVALR